MQDIEKHMGMVRYMANQIANCLPPSVDREELIQEGMVGLAAAIRRFDPEMGFKFTTFARHRIRGAILDYLRRQSSLSRATSLLSRKIETAKAQLRYQGMQTLSAEDIAHKAGVSLRIYQKHLAIIDSHHTYSLSDVVGSEGAETAESISDPRSFDALGRVLAHERMEIASSAFAQLARQDRELIELYYCDDWDMAQIGAKVGTSTSNISQRHSRIIRKIRRIVAERIVRNKKVPTEIACLPRRRLEI